MVRPVIPERQPGVQVGQLCGFLHLPRFYLWLGPTEEPGGAPGTGPGTPCWLNLSRQLLKPLSCCWWTLGVNWFSDSFSAALSPMLDLLPAHALTSRHTE